MNKCKSTLINSTQCGRHRTTTSFINMTATTEEKFLKNQTTVKQREKKQLKNKNQVHSRRQQFMNIYTGRQKNVCILQDKKVPLFARNDTTETPAFF